MEARIWGKLTKLCRRIFPKMANIILKYSKSQFYVRIQIVPCKEGSKSGWFEDPS